MPRPARPSTSSANGAAPASSGTSAISRRSPRSSNQAGRLRPDSARRRRWRGGPAGTPRAGRRARRPVGSIPTEKGRRPPPRSPGDPGHQLVDLGAAAGRRRRPGAVGTGTRATTSVEKSTVGIERSRASQTRRQAPEGRGARRSRAHGLAGGQGGSKLGAEQDDGPARSEPRRACSTTKVVARPAGGDVAQEVAAVLVLDRGDRLLLGDEQRHDVAALSSAWMSSGASRRLGPPDQPDEVGPGPRHLDDRRTSPVERTPAVRSWLRQPLDPEPTTAVDQLGIRQLGRWSSSEGRATATVREVTTTPTPRMRVISAAICRGPRLRGRAGTTRSVGGRCAVALQRAGRLSSEVDR